MAHLISLGGWLRGLEIAAGAVEANYTPERAASLWQRDLMKDYGLTEFSGTTPSA